MEHFRDRFERILVKDNNLDLSRSNEDGHLQAMLRQL